MVQYILTSAKLTGKVAHGADCIASNDGAIQHRGLRVMNHKLGIGRSECYRSQSCVLAQDYRNEQSVILYLSHTHMHVSGRDTEIYT